MKQLIFITLASGVLQIVNAQNRYSQGGLLHYQDRTLIIKEVSDTDITYTDANNPYNEYKPAISTNPEFVNEENYGWQKVDSCPSTAFVAVVAPIAEILTAI